MIDGFMATVTKAFQYLIDQFGFSIVDNKKDSYGKEIVYQNATTAISIRYEHREKKVFILVIRLIDGKIPKYEIFINDDIIINSFYLDDIIALKSPINHDEILKKNGHTTTNSLESIIFENAVLLKRFGSEILQGDFSIFPNLQKKVQDRAAQL